MTRLGFAGLGQMGRPIALHLLGEGIDLAVTSRRDEFFEAFRVQGAVASIDPAILAGQDIVLLCLPDEAAVAEMLFGRGDVARRLSPGALVVDLSTISPDSARMFGSQLEDRGIGFLDAPVSGMEARAVDGTLTAMCGGSQENFERAKPYLARFASRILHMGSVGTGQLAKLVNQLLFDVNMAALAEILPVAARLGLDPDTLADVVNSGTARSYASEFFLPRILQGDFATGYPMKAAYKDLVAAARLSSEGGFPLPVLAAATATYQLALLQGHGACDKGAMIRPFEDLLNARFRSRHATSGE